MFELGYDVYHETPVTLPTKTLLQIGVAIHLVLEASEYHCPHSEELYDALGLIEVALGNAGAVKLTHDHDQLVIHESAGGRHESE